MEPGGEPMDVKEVLDALKSTNDLDSRIALISRLQEAAPSFSTLDLPLVVDNLPSFWENNACSGPSHCSLNLIVLCLATKCLQSSSAPCYEKFLILGSKSSLWCSRHIEMMVNPVGMHLQEDTSGMILQLVLSTCIFSSTIYSSLTKFPLCEDEVTLAAIESSVNDQLRLMKGFINMSKNIHSISSALLKETQVVLDTIIKLSRTYFESIKSRHVDFKDGIQLSMASGVSTCSYQVLQLATCIVHSLYELGVIASSSGGSLVSILNTSWKGVVCLLQVGKGFFTDKINIQDVIETILLLATRNLRRVTESWCHMVEALDLSIAKRALLPVKFFLINAVRISSEYPCHAQSVYKVISNCSLLVSSLIISFSKESHLRAASESLAETLEPTSFLLLCTVINAVDVEHERKMLMLDTLFSDLSKSNSISCEEKIGKLQEQRTLADEEEEHRNIPGSGISIMGQTLLFLKFLQSSSLLSEDMVYEISRKLGYLLRMLMNVDVYSSALSLDIPQPSAYGANSAVLWAPIFPLLLQSLKTFLIVASSSENAWQEVEEFLSENLFHPHVICAEVMLELWCFMIRNAEKEVVYSILNSLNSLLQSIILSKPTLLVSRKMVQTISIIITSAPHTSLEHVYSSIIFDQSYSQPTLLIAMLMAGFPIDSLSQNLRNQLFPNAGDAFVGFVKDGIQKLRLLASSGSSGGSTLIPPIHHLSHAYFSRQFSLSNFFDKDSTVLLMKLTISVIHDYINADEIAKEEYSLSLSLILDILANINHAYTYEEMREITLELKVLSTIASSSPVFYQCKPALASFMAGLCHMDAEESESSNICVAVWELYHVLLRERHWAFIHLAVTAFGYFTARTSCSQLWRFLPVDAALSYDPETGNEANEGRFMSEFQSFLEKDFSSNINPLKLEFELLVKEGSVLKEKFDKISNIVNEGFQYEIMQIDGIKHVTQKNLAGFKKHVDKASNICSDAPETNIRVTDSRKATNKKRKIPEGFNEGLRMLQSGLKTINNALSCSDIQEIKEEFSTHISCLEDVIHYMIRLSGIE